MRPVTARRMTAYPTSLRPWRSARAATIARLLRGVPSASRARTTGIVRASMASSASRLARGREEGARVGIGKLLSSSTGRDRRVGPASAKRPQARKQSRPPPRARWSGCRPALQRRRAGSRRCAERGLWQTSLEPPWEFRKRRWAEAGSKAPGGCAIKGNISRKGERIYHTPWGDRFYERTRIDEGRGERWFCSEKEAADAGFRAPLLRLSEISFVEATIESADGRERYLVEGCRSGGGAARRSRRWWRTAGSALPLTEDRPRSRVSGGSRAHPGNVG